MLAAAGSQTGHPGKIRCRRRCMAAPLRPAAAPHRSRPLRSAWDADAAGLRPLSVARRRRGLSRKLRRKVRSAAHIQRAGPECSPRERRLAGRGRHEAADRSRSRRGDRMGGLSLFAAMARYGSVRRPDRPFEPLPQSSALCRQPRPRRRLRQFRRRDRSRPRGGRRRCDRLGARSGAHFAAGTPRPADPDLGHCRAMVARAARRRHQCAGSTPRCG